MIFNSKSERDEFIISYLPLVNSRVMKLNDRIYDKELFQVGSLGLIYATDNFDENRKNKFSTYAVCRIDGEILRYKKSKNRYEYEKSVSLDELCECGTLYSDDTNIERNVLDKMHVETFMDSLIERERRVMDLRLEGLTQKNISQETDINQPKISIILKRIGKRYLNSLEAIN